MEPRTEARGLDFIHRFIPAAVPSAAPTLLLLHGTGGNENDLLELGRVLAPRSSLLAPRGKVLERGMPRFFRRFAEGVFDLEDLAARTDELVEFLKQAAGEYHFDAKRIVAVGYSNGANIAASTLLRHPAALAGAVLFRPMLPFEPEQRPELSGTPVFIAAGDADTMVPRSGTLRLAEVLEASGAQVTVRWQQAGHELMAPEVELAKQWLATTVDGA